MAVLGSVKPPELSEAIMVHRGRSIECHRGAGAFRSVFVHWLRCGPKRRAGFSGLSLENARIYASTDAECIAAILLDSSTAVGGDGTGRGGRTGARHLRQREALRDLRAKDDEHNAGACFRGRTNGAWCMFLGSRMLGCSAGMSLTSRGFWAAYTRRYDACIAAAAYKDPSTKTGRLTDSDSR